MEAHDGGAVPVLALLLLIILGALWYRRRRQRREALIAMKTTTVKHSQSNGGAAGEGAVSFGSDRGGKVGEVRLTIRDGDGILEEGGAGKLGSMLPRANSRPHDSADSGMGRGSLRSEGSAQGLAYSDIWRQASLPSPVPHSQVLAVTDCERVVQSASSAANAH